MPNVARRSRFDRTEFRNSFLQPRVPVVYTQGAADWPAVQKWTPAYLSASHGDAEFELETASGYGQSESSRPNQRMRLLEYVAAIERGERPPTLPYARNIFLCTRIPALLADVRVPEMADPNWLLHPSLARLVKKTWLQWYELFLSPANTRFPWVHVDRDHTQAWLLQIFGRKKVWCWPAQAGTDLRAAERLVTADEDLDRYFPGYEPTIALVEPGDLLYIPSGWWHTAQSETISITLSGNWVEETTWEEFFASYFLSERDLDERRRAGLIALRELVASAYASRRPSDRPSITGV